MMICTALKSCCQSRYVYLTLAFTAFSLYVISTIQKRQKLSERELKHPYNLMNQDLKPLKHPTEHHGHQSLPESKPIRKYIGVDPRSALDKRNLEFLVERGLFEPESQSVASSEKIILWYIPTRFHPRLPGLHPLRGCPGTPCKVTTNRLYYKKSDAVLFTAQLLTDKPPVKLPHQTWILHNHESPRWAITETSPLNSKNWRSLFNWTMDYRDDADIANPYAVFPQKGGVFVRSSQVQKDYNEIMAMKNSEPEASVAWVVSNCKAMSRRGHYVREMQKYIKVDIYGQCGAKTCPRASDNECQKFLSRNYKFYLAFENAFCKDYITEKFFQYYKSDLVTVVRGGGNYSKNAPSGTYVNAADFHSPRELAEYLKKLSKDKERYLNILKEKDHYEPETESWPIVKQGKVIYMTYHYDAAPMCQVCERLWNPNDKRKHYEDIGKWFSKGICTQPKDLPVDSSEFSIRRLTIK